MPLQKNFPQAVEDRSTILSEEIRRVSRHADAKDAEWNAIGVLADERNVSGSPRKAAKARADVDRRSGEKLEKARAPQLLDMDSASPYANFLRPGGPRHEEPSKASDQERKRHVVPDPKHGVEPRSRLRGVRMPPSIGEERSAFSG